MVVWVLLAEQRKQAYIQRAADRCQAEYFPQTEISTHTPTRGVTAAPGMVSRMLFWSLRFVFDNMHLKSAVLITKLYSLAAAYKLYAVSDTKYVIYRFVIVNDDIASDYLSAVGVAVTAIMYVLMLNIRLDYE